MRGRSYCREYRPCFVFIFSKLPDGSIGVPLPFMKYALLALLCLATVSLAQAAPPEVKVGYLPPGFSVTKTVVEPASPAPQEDEGMPEDRTAARQVVLKLEGQAVREYDFGMSNFVSVSELHSATAKKFPSIIEAAKGLKALLAKRPATPPNELPVYPPSDAALEIATHFTYIDAEWGSGYGAVVIFAQDTPRVTNADIVYYFQGLTKDGRYYVTASFALTNPKLPANYEVADQNATTEDDIKMLKKLPGDSFTPALDELRKLIESLVVSGG